MIIVHLKGDLGNQMCQYAIGRIIAEKKNYKLILDESGDGWKNILPDFFPNFKQIDGAVIETNPISLGGSFHHLDYQKLFDHDGFIFLKGFWQKYCLFESYESQIKNWFWYDDTNHEKPDKDDVVVHCRLYRSDEHKIIPPINTFIDIVNTLPNGYNKCIVVTDDPNNSLLNQFKCIKNLSIRNKSRMEDFTFMKYAKRLIISQSTFSWWATFLGHQDVVYVPLTENLKIPHYWKANPDSYFDIDLIPNNKKYIKFNIN